MGGGSPRSTAQTGDGKLNEITIFICRGRDDAVVRALTSYQCGPDSIPGVDTIYGLSLLLVPVPALKVFQISKFQFNLETVDE